MENVPAYTQENRFYTRNCDNVVSELYKEYPLEEVTKYGDMDLLIKDFINFLMLAGYNEKSIKIKLNKVLETIKE